ncbi:response regulator transcription factor [Neobacillus ginsengisoli]|uniref:DNA-binding response OmpR family regulator n=1 Tax=Neobacillus ginsengisoli TaxID=904295 RepID=A0ABT9XW49_9BACI|nr:response regulator transcription factor [Neobacillus ginsengisoli]MDQ0199107.1 DNA-binding response OmpR family regulator [Neobacillus ginsengisoli]
MKHVFVVDDEKNIRDILQKYIENEGYKVTLFSDGQHVYQEMLRLKPDLLIIDIMMPHIDGLDLCKEIRKTSDIPIIFVSARDGEFDRILGLELGGDDYLTKPFSPRELMVRIKNIFKRIEKSAGGVQQIVTIRDVTIDTDKRYIEKGGQEIKLTTKEYDLFLFLAKNKGKPFTREELLEFIWGYEFAGDGRLIDDLVKRVRKKIEHSSVELSTIWGFGYRIDD